MRHSVEFKRSAVEKYFRKGNRSVEDLVRELGVSRATLYLWRGEYANVINMKKPTQPQSRTVKEKLKAIMEYEVLPEENRGEYLRLNGLHKEHIIEWREQIEAALSPQKTSQDERKRRSTDLKKVKDLEKELRRKDKALAEVSALLVLKKKADLIWGSVEDE